MKNSNNHKTTKSPIRQITNFVVLLVIFFLAISCNLNAGENGKTEETVKILTGPCGETKENSNDVVEINGQKYYTTKSNYYALKTDTTSEEAKMRAEIKDEDLYDDIRVKYWNEWIPGNYTEDTATAYHVYFESPSFCRIKNNPGVWIVRKDGAYHLCDNGYALSKKASFIIVTENKFDTNGFGTFIRDKN